MTGLLKAILITVLLLSINYTSRAQSNIDLEEVEVNASRASSPINQTARQIRLISKEDIENAPVETLNELLEYVTNIDIRQRGANGIQADVSLRGSSFEQVLILLNGIKMSDPQTGHHNLNLPIGLTDIDRIEVLYGGASRVYGPAAFAGAINIITKNPVESSVKGKVAAGEFGYTELGAAAVIKNEDFSHRVSFERTKSDGYIRNTDFTNSNIFWQSEYHGESSDWFLNIGQNNKAFGAQNFYTASFPEQFEETQTQFISFGGSYQMNQLRIEPRAYYRKHNDRFELFREGDGFYQPIENGYANSRGDTVSWYQGHNYHQTDVYGAELNLNYQSKLGITSLGYDYRFEEIKSNVLGEPLDNQEAVKGNEDQNAFYTNGDSRINHNIYIEHSVVINELYLSAGILYNINSAFDENLYSGFDIAYQVNENFRPYGSVNKSLRFPTYTDLYYRLGGAIGSKELKEEESLNYELGLKVNLGTSSGHFAWFRREGKNLIDWIRFEGSNITQAANISEVTISGVETDWLFKPIKPLLKIVESIRVGYSYLYSDTTSQGFESNYALDFLKHKADVGFTFKPFSKIYVNWSFSYQDRVGDYINSNGEKKNYQSVLLSDIRISPKIGKVLLFLQVSNLFNVDYVDIGSVEQPGRWVKVGVSFGVPISKKE